MLANQCLFLAWILLLRRTGHFRPRHLGRYARIWWIPCSYRYIPGKVLLLVERARMGAAAGIPPAAGAASTIVETLLAILAGSAVSLFAVSYYSGAESNALPIAGASVMGSVFLFPAAYRAFCRIPAVESRFPELQSVALRYRDLLIAMLPYVLHYLLLGTSFLLLSRGLASFSWSGLPGLCGIYALSHVAGLVALIAPGGLGVREGALAVQLGRFVPAGIAEVLAIGLRVWFTLIELMCYVAVAVFCPPLRGVERAAKA